MPARGRSRLSNGRAGAVPRPNPGHLTRPEASKHRNAAAAGRRLARRIVKEGLTVRAAERAAHEGGYLWLGFLEVEGVKAAASLNFDYKNKLWGYNSGVRRDFMELSPGWVLLAHVIQWCCENGRYEFDFMRGDEEYKYRFGGVNRYVMRERVTR